MKPLTPDGDSQQHDVVETRLRETERQIGLAVEDAAAYGDGWIKVSRQPDGSLRYTRQDPTTISVSVPAESRRPPWDFEFSMGAHVTDSDASSLLLRHGVLPTPEVLGGKTAMAYCRHVVEVKPEFLESLLRLVLVDGGAATLTFCDLGPPVWPAVQALATNLGVINRVRFAYGTGLLDAHFVEQAFADAKLDDTEREERRVHGPRAEERQAGRGRGPLGSPSGAVEGGER